MLTPIIALTADVFACGERRDPSTALIDDCLHKPASEASLLRMLEKWRGRQAGDDPATGKISIPMERHSTATAVL